MAGTVEGLARRVYRRLPAATAAQVDALLHADTPLQRSAATWVARRRARAALQTYESTTLKLQVASTSRSVVVAHRVEEFSALSVLEANLTAVMNALQADGVEFAVLEAAVMRRRRLVVTGDHAAAARAALARHLGPMAFYCCDVRGDTVTGPAVAIRELPKRAHLKDSGVLRCFTFGATQEAALYGAELGCDVEVWAVSSGSGKDSTTELTPGTALAPRPNRWTSHLAPAQRRLTYARVGGRDVPTYSGLLHPHLFDVHFPIDIVYTWVDGSDPEWLQRKQAAWAASSQGTYHQSAATSSRYISRDELRYSLRSLQMYADWIRNVYIVTDSQVPDWLAVDNPRIRVVDHKEIFDDPDCLPTFNSHAIESRLHHIDGMSEHFLYMNDDTFFGRPVSPELFFHGNALMKIFPTTSTLDLAMPSSQDLPVTSAGKNNRYLIERSTGRTVSQKYQHVAHPHRRSVLLKLEQEFHDAFAATARSRFRSPDDISVASSLGQSYAFAHGFAVPGEVSYRYIDITHTNADTKMNRLLRGRDADVFCLNEVALPAQSAAVVDERVARFLAAYFPLPSSFERTSTAPSGVPGHPNIRRV